MDRIKRRTALPVPTEYRAAEDESGIYIEGYFAVFNSEYRVCDGITESIAPGAFSGCISGDVRALTNHDTTLVLGRSKAGTLELREDSRGLWGRVRVNSQDGDAMNLYRRVQRGDVDQCSFGFEIGAEELEFREDGSAHWTITRVEPLYEVSVCTFPAYEETSVSARRADTEDARRVRTAAWREEMRNKLKGGHGNGTKSAASPEEA